MVDLRISPAGICPAEALQLEPSGVDGLFDLQRLCEPSSSLGVFVLLGLERGGGQLHAGEAGHQQRQRPLFSRLHGRAAQRLFHREEPTLVRTPGELGCRLACPPCVGSGSRDPTRRVLPRPWATPPTRRACENCGRRRPASPRTRVTTCMLATSPYLAMASCVSLTMLDNGVWASTSLRGRRVHAPDVRAFHEHGVPRFLTCDRTGCRPPSTAARGAGLAVAGAAAGASACTSAMRHGHPRLPSPCAQPVVASGRAMSCERLDGVTTWRRPPGWDAMDPAVAAAGMEYSRRGGVERPELHPPGAHATPLACGVVRTRSNPKNPPRTQLRVGCPTRGFLSPAAAHIPGARVA